MRERRHAVEAEAVREAVRSLVHDVAHDAVTEGDFSTRVAALVDAVGLDGSGDRDLVDVLGHIGLDGWAAIEAVGIDEMATVMARCCDDAEERRGSDDRDERWAWAWEAVYVAVPDWCETPRGRAQGYDFTERVVRACRHEMSVWTLLDMWLDGDDAETAWHFPDPEVQARVRSAINGAGWFAPPEKLPTTPELTEAVAARTAARKAIEAVGGARWAFNPEPSPEQLAAEEAYHAAQVAHWRALERALGRDPDAPLQHSDPR